MGGKGGDVGRGSPRHDPRRRVRDVTHRCAAPAIAISPAHGQARPGWPTLLPLTCRRFRRRIDNYDLRCFFTCILTRFLYFPNGV